MQEKRVIKKSAADFIKSSFAHQNQENGATFMLNTDQIGVVFSLNNTQKLAMGDRKDT